MRRDRLHIITAIARQVKKMCCNVWFFITMYHTGTISTIRISHEYGRRTAR